MSDLDNNLEARLAAIVASSDDAIVSKDLNGVIRTWNRAAERMFGYTAEEAIGKSITIIIPEDRLPEEDEVLSRIRAGLSVDHFQTVRRHKSGRLLDISLTVSPIRNANGQIIGASKIARDMTEAQRLKAMAEEANRLKDEFLAVLSHELRTPLNTVVGYARMLRREDIALTPEQRGRALDALERNADALARLVNDVLDTSRIVTGKLRLSLAPCDLSEVIADAVETILPAAQAKGIAVEKQLDPNLTIVADQDRLRQVFWNLLSNAVKFTPPGGLVSAHAHRSGQVIEAEVRDTGVGIEPEHLARVFQRFWQANTGTAREFGGLGLGLALARHLVELHGGMITATSPGPSLGSTFTVVLPTAARALAQERELRRVAR